VADAVLAQIVEGAETLIHQNTDFVLGQLVPLQHVGEEIASLAEVSHDEQHLLPFPNFSYVQNVWVIQLAKDLILANEASHVGDFTLMHSLDGHTLLC